MSKQKTKKIVRHPVATSIRLDQDVHAYLKGLKNSEGATMTFVINKAIRGLMRTNKDEIEWA